MSTPRRHRTQKSKKKATRGWSSKSGPITAYGQSAGQKADRFNRNRVNVALVAVPAMVA